MKKRIVVLSVALILVFQTTVSAGAWQSYFGLNKGWYEGTKGKMVKNTYSNWTAKIKSIGWGGCWGGQVFQKGISIKKGHYYHLSFRIKSTKLSKWVYIKIGDEKGTKNNYHKWLNCKKKKTVKVNTTFKAKYNGNSIYFGIGGDFHDRSKVKTDKDAKKRYKVAPNKKLDARLKADYAADHPTTIKCTKFSFYDLSKNTKKRKRIKKVVIYYY